MLPGSDFDHELVVILCIIHRCLEDEKNGRPSLLDRSTDLDELIRYYKEET